MATGDNVAVDVTVTVDDDMLNRAIGAVLELANGRPPTDLEIAAERRKGRERGMNSADRYEELLARMQRKRVDREMEARIDAEMDAVIARARVVDVG